MGWSKRYIPFHDRRHLRDIGNAKVAAFLTSLTLQRNVATSTRQQALAAILFLYRHVLEVALPWLDDVVGAKKPRPLPTVQTPEEVQALPGTVPDEACGFIVRLPYGTGMRLLEALRLRVKDVDLGRREIVVRDGKGGKDRITALNASLLADMKAQLARGLALHRSALVRGRGVLSPLDRFA